MSKRVPAEDCQLIELEKVRSCLLDQVRVLGTFAGSGLDLHTSLDGLVARVSDSIEWIDQRLNDLYDEGWEQVSFWLQAEGPTPEWPGA